MEKSHRIVNAAIQYGAIEERDRNIYEVAVPSLFFSMFTWETLLVFGMIVGVVYRCVLFLLFHIPLRVYAGGFHQNTRVKSLLWGFCYGIMGIRCYILLLRRFC